MRKSNIIISIVVVFMALGLFTCIISGISWLASTYLSIKSLKLVTIISALVTLALFIILLFLPYNTEENE